MILADKGRKSNMLWSRSTGSMRRPSDDGGGVVGLVASGSGTRYAQGIQP